MIDLRKSHLLKLALAVMCVGAQWGGANAQNFKSNNEGSHFGAGASITLKGTAVPVCNLGNPLAGASATNASFSSNVVSVNQFIDSRTALVVPASITFQFTNAMCNSNASLTLTTKNSGMSNQGGSAVANGSSAFLQTVHYTVRANWASVSITLDTNKGSTVSTPLGGAISGPLTLTFQNQAGTLPVPQGAYQDVVTLKLAAIP